jgi:hypothetical protein
MSVRSAARGNYAWRLIDARRSQLDKAEVTHRMDFSDSSDEQLLIRLRDETEALLLERRAAGLDSAGDDPEPST